MFWFFSKKLKWSDKLSGFALIPGGILWLMLWANFTIDIVVIDKNLIEERYMAFYGGEYEAEDGQKINITGIRDDKLSTAKVFIINCSDSDLTIETIDYGKSYRALASDLIRPHILYSHRTMYSVSVPDYFPYERPPESLRATRGVSGIAKKWLRTATTEEISNKSEDDSHLVPLSDK